MSSRRIRRIASTALTRLALAVFLLRAVIPAGFMPAPASNGWPLQLCPEGLTHSQMMILLGSGHHHQHHGDNLGTDGDNSHEELHCAIGLALSTAFLNGQHAEIVVAELTAVVPTPVAADPVVVESYGLFRSRAPPVS